MSSTPTHTLARVFFALWPNEIERTSLAAWQSPLLDRCGGRTMHPDTLHSTLAFVGEVERTRLKTLELAAQTVRGVHFEITLDAARYWAHNRIVYAAPSHLPCELSHLVQQLEHSLRQHDFHLEPRQFTPHVTLLRHAVWTDTPPPKMGSVRWRCREFVLVESKRDAQGAPYYATLARFPLV